MSRLQYHHLGIPTKRKLPDKDYVPHLKLYASGFEGSPYGIEWMNFDDDCQLPDLVKLVPHIAFVVKDITEAIAGKELLIEPNCPSRGITVAFIVENGAPVELLQFDGNEYELWPEKALYR